MPKTEITEAQFTEDYRVMLTASLAHLNEAVANGNRVRAHDLVDTIIDLQRILEDRGAAERK